VFVCFSVRRGNSHWKRLQDLAGALHVDGLVGLLLGAEGPERDGLVWGPVAAGLQAFEHGVVQVVRAGVAVVAATGSGWHPYVSYFKKLSIKTAKNITINFDGTTKWGLHRKSPKMCMSQPVGRRQGLPFCLWPWVKFCPLFSLKTTCRLSFSDYLDLL
jgi:hypothetical protein